MQNHTVRWELGSMFWRWRGLTSITQGLREKQIIRASPKTCWIRNSGVRTSTLWFNKLSGGSDAHLSSKVVYLKGEKEHTWWPISILQRVCWVAITTPLLQLNRKQPSMKRAPKRIRGNSLLPSCEGTIVKQWPKVTTTAKSKGSSLKYLEKHAQCPAIIYIWLLKDLFSWLLRGKEGWWILKSFKWT
jgi:hypothetical protein